MDYLALTNRMISECGVSGGPLTTIVGAQGSLLRCANWVQEAWIDIQTAHDDWLFMRSSRLLGAGASFPTISGQLFYELGVGVGDIGIEPEDFGSWDMDSFRCMTTTTGIADETFMDKVGFDAWRDAYMYGAMQQVVTRPVAIAKGPQNQLCVGPASNGQYTITGDYFMAAQELSSNTDVPGNLAGNFILPRRFQMLIVYGAMQYYAAYESAPEVKQRADDGVGDLMPKLEALYLPEFSSGSALA